MIKAAKTTMQLALALLAVAPTWAHAKKRKAPAPPIRRIVLPTITLNCARPSHSALTENASLLNSTDQVLGSPEIGMFRGNFSKIDRTVREVLQAGDDNKKRVVQRCNNARVDQICAMSPWATLSIADRARALTKVAAAVQTPYSKHGLDSARLIPCVAMRESTLEPASTFEDNCRGQNINSRGLFQIELPTLEDMTEFGFVAKDYPRAELDSKGYAKFLHTQIESDIKLQIEIMHATFARKKESFYWDQKRNYEKNYVADYKKKYGKDPKKIPTNPHPRKATLTDLLERYNGSGMKREYATAVTQCMNCLKLGKEEIETCLVKSHSTGRRALASWDRCKHNSAKIALGETPGEIHGGTP